MRDENHANPEGQNGGFEELCGVCFSWGNSLNHTAFQGCACSMERAETRVYTRLNSTK
jgi:hypothetical protein